MVLPSSMDVVGVGDSFTTAGTPKPGVGGVLLPQPAKRAIDPVIRTEANINLKLRMRAPGAAGEIILVNIGFVGNLSV
ncbi:MAG TPA: hypothetical protein VMT53_21960 [Terriglobales bacterium]|nr:hypothetical protein [Terriglobales bacterium]